MVFDLEMIRDKYAGFAEKIAVSRKVIKRPMALTEKILYAHLDEGCSMAVSKNCLSSASHRPISAG